MHVSGQFESVLFVYLFNFGVALVLNIKSTKTVMWGQFNPCKFPISYYIW